MNIGGIFSFCIKQIAAGEDHGMTYFQETDLVRMQTVQNVVATSELYPIVF